MHSIDKRFSNRFNKRLGRVKRILKWIGDKNRKQNKIGDWLSRHFTNLISLRNKRKKRYLIRLRLEWIASTIKLYDKHKVLSYKIDHHLPWVRLSTQLRKWHERNSKKKKRKSWCYVARMRTTLSLHPQSTLLTSKLSSRRDRRGKTVIWIY